MDQRRRDPALLGCSNRWGCVKALTAGLLAPRRFAPRGMIGYYRASFYGLQRLRHRTGRFQAIDMASKRMARLVALTNISKLTQFRPGSLLVIVQRIYR